MIMSGVEDGLLLTFNTASSDGQVTLDKWILTIGRREDCDICLRNDTYISREHAALHWRDNRWWLEDCDSKNGTFIESGEEDARVSGTIPIAEGQLFRIGRTWLRIQPTE
jgi:pSer/pThr/pTyr-binding forkhead associated (FHA) protein